MLFLSAQLGRANRGFRCCWKWSLALAFSDSGVRFSLRRLRKAQHSGPLQPVFISTFPDPFRCPVAALRDYVERTSPRRNGLNTNSLFIALISPFRAVSSATISRWIRSIMLSAGIDTAVFSAHSTRGAAASRASAAGVGTDSILRLGHCAHESTFARFYKRNVDSSVAAAVFGEQA